MSWRILGTTKISWAPSQYPERRLFVRSRKVSKPRDWYFKLSYRFEISQAHRQHCCRSACHISERSDNSKYKIRGFETLRDLTERRLFGYWDGALAAFNKVTASECLHRCAHHTGCYAYNFSHKQGVCVLLRGVGPCGETTDQFDRNKYVHLGACNGQQPWLTGVMNWTTGASYQMWYRQAAVSRRSCPGGMVTNRDGWACVALIPTKGLYLPGWYMGAYRVITEDAWPK